jgi:hypothetical protein
MSRDSGFYYLLTFTAPGARAHCMRKGCEGQGDGLDCPHPRCDCTPVGGVDLALWNASHGKRWNRLLTALRRAYPGFVFMRGCEVQDGKRREDGEGRGALHDHLIAWSPAPMDLREVRALAIRSGFGHSVDLERVSPTSRKASEYVSKYVSKSVDERAAVPWLRVRPAGAGALVPGGALWDDEGGYFVELHDDDGDSWRAWTPVRLSADATFRAWSKSQTWGQTMAEVRQIGRDYAARMEAARAAAEAAPAVVDVVEVVDPVPVLTSDAPGEVWRSYVRAWTEPPT